MQTYRVAEKFVSINGEGSRAGELAVFIRLAGCNLRCAYCDTAWAWEAACPGEDLTAAEILRYIRATGIRNVTLTGGEPLMSPGVLELVQSITAADGLSLEIETNGSIDIAPLAALPDRPLFTLDYKLPASGMESRMHRPSFAFLGAQDVVKFVCSDLADMARAVEVIDELELLGRVQIYFSPVFGRIDPADMVEFMRVRRLNGVKLQLQLHKFIWPPDARGV